MLDQIAAQAPLFFLIAARCFAMIVTVPLLSTNAVSRVVKLALAGYIAYILLPSVSYAVWNVDLRSPPKVVFVL